jgi:hypothetical protein
MKYGNMSEKISTFVLLRAGFRWAPLKFSSASVFPVKVIEKDNVSAERDGWCEKGITIQSAEGH